MFGLQPQDLLIILIVALVLFGPNQLPKLARAIGESLREFRKATDEVKGSLDTSPTPAPPAPAPVKPTIVLPKPPWRIFLSSVLKDMGEERARVKKAIESLPDLAQAWTWEEGSYASPFKTPAEEYLPEVSACHIFLLLVKDDLTTPVRKEYDTARAANKPMLVFVKNCERTAAAQEVVDAVGKEITYAVFTDSDEPDPSKDSKEPDRLADLDNKVRQAVGRLVLDKFDVDETRRRALEEQLTVLAQKIAEREKRLAESAQEIAQLKGDKQILTATTIAGPIVGAAVGAAVVAATSQPTPPPAEPEPPAPRIEVTTPEPPPSEKPDTLFASQSKRGRDGKRMILIPASEFLRGTSDADALEMSMRFGWDVKSFEDEKPQRKIYLDAYYIAETPVTNAEYKKFVDVTGHRIPFYDADWAKLYNWDKLLRTYPLGKENHPVVLVDWDDANAYARWVGGRLPTEAEWEKAARGTDGRRYPWGNADPDATRCNFNGNENGTTPVDKYSPRGDSPYGLKDMAGNVWEWCADWYDADYYKNSPGRNPKGPNSGGWHVLRGGSWNNSNHDARCAYRYDNTPDYRNYNIGFRVAESFPT